MSSRTRLSNQDSTWTYYIYRTGGHDRRRRVSTRSFLKAKARLRGQRCQHRMTKPLCCQVAACAVVRQDRDRPLEAFPWPRLLTVTCTYVGDLA